MRAAALAAACLPLPAGAMDAAQVIRHAEGEVTVWRGTLLPAGPVVEMVSQGRFFDGRPPVTPPDWVAADCGTGRAIVAAGTVAPPAGDGMPLLDVRLDAARAVLRAGRGLDAAAAALAAAGVAVREDGGAAAAACAD